MGVTTGSRDHHEPCLAHPGRVDFSAHGHKRARCLVQRFRAPEFHLDREPSTVSGVHDGIGFGSGCVREEEDLRVGCFCVGAQVSDHQGFEEETEGIRMGLMYLV